MNPGRTQKKTVPSGPDKLLKRKWHSHTPLVTINLLVTHR